MFALGFIKVATEEKKEHGYARAAGHGAITGLGVVGGIAGMAALLKATEGKKAAKEVIKDIVKSVKKKPGEVARNIGHIAGIGATVGTAKHYMDKKANDENSAGKKEHGYGRAAGRGAIAGLGSAAALTALHAARLATRKGPQAREFAKDVITVLKDKPAESARLLAGIAGTGAILGVGKHHFNKKTKE